MRKNVQLVMQLYSALAEKDVEAMQSLSDPNIEIHQSAELPWGGVYRGLSEAVQFFAKVTGFLDSKVTPEQTIDAGDFVAVVGRTEGTVKQTGRTFQVPLVHIWGVKHNRITSLAVLLDYPSISSALKG